jgi:CheY-like chemotaxis protein
MDKPSSSVILSASQLAKIKEQLLEADRHILAGRYLAAERALDEVFAVDPHNEVALSYRERIRYLTKQLMQRVSLSKDVQTEIRKAKELLRQKKSKEINDLLAKGKSLMEKDNLKEAARQFRKVLEIDNENIYAKALLERIDELEPQIISGEQVNAAEMNFIAILRQSWRNGVPSDIQMQTIKQAQKEMNISEGRHLALERRIKNFYYKEALKEVWLTGGISAFAAGNLSEELRQKYAVSLIDYTSIEAELIQEVRKNKVRGVVLLVDTDDQILMETARRFRRNSYAVVAAVNYDEAMATIKSSKVDVVISEIQIGSVATGFELFTFVRSNALTKTVPFFLASTEIDRQTLLISKRVGVDDLFMKPLDYEMVFATLDGAFNRRTEQEGGSTVVPS